MAQEEGICPIESNIKSTFGNDDQNDYQFDDQFDPEFGDENDAEFDDDDGDDMDGDDGWGSVHSSNDGQDVIPITDPLQQQQQNEYKPVIDVNEENPYGEGNEVQVRNGAKPQISMNDPKQKCWICDICNGINNLLESMQKYNYQCCICGYAYHPNVAIIFSNEWDGVNENNPEEQIYQIWNCPFCTLQNDIKWNKCDGCDCRRPPEGQYEIGFTYNKPKKMNGAPEHNQVLHQAKMYENGNFNDNRKNKKINNKNNRNIVRRPRISNIGVARTIDQYPAKSTIIGDDKLEQRLSTIFGRPYRNSLITHDKQNMWTVNLNLAHSRIDWASYSNDAKGFVTEEIVGRGFAVNQRNGWVATMSSKYIWVFEPFGSCGFKLKARYQFTEDQKLSGEDVNNSRIRFLNNSIFVWSFARSRVYSFKLSYNSIILVDVIRDKYFKDSQTIDVAITDSLLILLFDRWCGVYKLYPKFEWYHAVAFANKTVNCFSFEIVDYDDEEDKIPMEQEAFFRDDDDEEKNGSDQQLVLKDNVFMSKFRSKRQSKSKHEWQDEMKENDGFYKPTNKNYMFINAENQIIGLHPTNPTFDFLHIAKDAQHGKCKYCISKRYGTFYLGNDGKSLYQSAHLEFPNQRLIDLNSAEYLADKFYPIEQFHDMVLRQGIEKFVNIQFDETYGVSGRLLLFCQTKKSEFVMHQLFNHEELSPFSNELSTIDYYMMPGQTRKPFNLTIYVYEMLYGQDLVEMLLQSPYFNPALLRIKKQQENEMERIQNEKQQPPPSAPQKQDLDIVDIAPGGNQEPGDDDMEIEYEPEGVM